MRDRLNAWLCADSRQKILLLRHGAIQPPDDKKRLIGRIDLPLSDTGRQQAQYWREYLAEIQLARIISSDLSRCMETASIIATHRSITVESLPGLREIDLGQWDGLRVGQIKQRWPDAYRQRGLQMACFRPPAGESFLDLQKRVIPVFEKTISQNGTPVLIVAHAGVNRMILCHLLGMPPENLLRIDQGEGAMNLIDQQAKGYRIQALNLLPAG